MIELKVVHAGTARLEEFIVDGLVDLALMAEISSSRLIALTRLAEEEMVLMTRPGARPRGFVSVEELNRTPLILGDGLRAALDVLLAGRGIALQVDTELERSRDDPADGAARRRRLDPAALLGLSRMRARAGAKRTASPAAGSSAPWRSGTRRAAARRRRGKRWPRSSPRCSPTSRPTASCARIVERSGSRCGITPAPARTR